MVNRKGPLPLARIPMPSWRIWMLAIRPWSLTISTVPVTVATLLVWQAGRVSVGMFFLMLFASVLHHISCNLANDLFDHIKGVDAAQLLGPGRMLQRGRLTTDDLCIGIAALLALALLVGLPVIIHLGWIGVGIALLYAGIGLLYTGGPIPLVYTRLGRSASSWRWVLSW